MTVSYIALIRKEPHTDYWVDIPDIPGCVAGAATAQEAKMYFAQVLELHLKGTKEDGLSLKAPRSREQVLADDHDSTVVEAYVIEIEPF